MPQPASASLSAHKDVEAPWSPDLFVKQFEVLNDRHRRLLVSGPRKTGKSIAICHKICSHLWNTNGAKVALFTTSYKVATDGGSWTDLIEMAIPMWIGLVDEETGAEFKYTTHIRGDEEGGPKLDAKSRTPFFRIQNRYGGESECRLFSIDNENEIAAKTKQLRFSAVWVIELSTFKTRKILEYTLLLLRAHGVPRDEMFWISDTNPAEEGKEHWAYKVFYRDRIDPDYTDKEFQRMTGLIEIFLDDNTKLDPVEKRELENIYRDMPDEYNRFVLGLWPDSAARGRELFADILTPQHFADGVIDVHRTSETLATGWDMGGINSAFVIVERRLVDGIEYWCVLDEVVHTNHEISTADFTLQCLEKMISINSFYRERWPMFPGFQWRHWSDNSSTAFFRPQLGSVDAALVFKVSDGQIELQGVDKPAGSVEEDVKMFRMLIRESRFFVGSNCPHMRKCLKEIKKGVRWIVTPDDPLKHVFDACRYAIRSEWLNEFAVNPRMLNASPSFTQVPLR